MIVMRVVFAAAFSVSVLAGASAAPPVGPAHMVAKPSPSPTPSQGVPGGSTGGSSSNTVTTYTVLEFTITTGGDDLRKDSGAVVHVNGPSSTHECWLKKAHQGDSWPENSVHTVPCEVGTKGITLAELRNSAIRLSLIESAKNFGPFNSPDNWDVQRVVVGAYRPGSGQKPVCILDVSGTPLVRLTATAPTSKLSDYPSSC
jgi:hypothetical protein